MSAGHDALTANPLDDIFSPLPQRRYFLWSILTVGGVDGGVEADDVDAAREVVAERPSEGQRCHRLSQVSPESQGLVQH
jgi:hypothetical protein